MATHYSCHYEKQQEDVFIKCRKCCIECHFSTICSSVSNENKPIAVPDMEMQSAFLFNYEQLLHAFNNL